MWSCYSCCSSHWINRSIYGYKTHEEEEKTSESPEDVVSCPIRDTRGSKWRKKEPEERNEGNHHPPLLSPFLGQGLIDFLISRPSTYITTCFHTCDGGVIPQWRISLMLSRLFICLTNLFQSKLFLELKFNESCDTKRRGKSSNGKKKKKRKLWKLHSLLKLILTVVFPWGIWHAWLFISWQQLN